MLNKQALLDWMQREVDEKRGSASNVDQGIIYAYSKLALEIQSGRFDAPSDDRLRAALGRAQMALRKAHNYSALGWSIQDMLNFTAEESRVALEALSTTAEPTGAERVREAWEKIPTLPIDQGDHSIYRAGFIDGISAAGITIPGINATEKEDTNG